MGIEVSFENGEFITSETEEGISFKHSPNKKREKKGRHSCSIIQDYTVIDLETTGLMADNCEIIEVAALRVRNGEAVCFFESLVKPKNPINAFIEALTGITNEMVENAPSAEEVIPKYLKFIGNDIVVGHNIASFDTCLIYDYSMNILNKPFVNNMVDTLHFSRRCKIETENYRLQTIAEYLEIPYIPHRALNDCVANYRCYEKLKPLLCIDEKKTNGTKKNRFSESTKALIALSKIIKILVDKNTLTDAEISGLMKWMHENRYLVGNYPFDDIFEKMQNIDTRGINEAERQELLRLLSEYVDPVSSHADENEVDFSAKNVCLTGDFVSGTKKEITAKFESAGAVVQKNVTLKTDFLIVGGNGNNNWTCGNYGSKVKKAVEMQNDGKEIKIMREDVALKCLNLKKCLTA